MQNECMCYDIYGTQSEDCLGFFGAEHAWQKFCTPCKKVALRERVRRHRYKRERQSDFPEGYSGMFQKGRKCSHCGDECVPEEHLYFCLHCWRVLGNLGPSDAGEEVHPPVQFLSAYDKFERNGPIHHYRSGGFSQNELWLLVPSANRDFWKSKDPIHKGIYYVYCGHGEHHSTAIKDNKGKWHFVPAERMRLTG